MNLTLPFNFKNICFALVLSFCSLQINAQMPCGMPDITPDEARALIEDLEILRRADVTPTGLITVPFQPHIVRTDAGTGGPNVTNAINNIIAARDKYLPYGITLDILPINYINNTDLMVLGTNGDPGSGYTEGDNILQLNNVPNVVNAYFVDTAYGSSGGSIGGYARFPWNLPNDYFVIVNNNASDNGTTVAHEMGHYFGLLHTFETAYAVELVNGSNCGVAGDLLCDTPADGYHTFGDVNSGTCAYTSGTDANGDPYAADPTQIMSYNQPFSCSTNFSSDAEDRMRFYMGKEDPNNTRAYLFQPTMVCSSYSAVLGAGGTVSVTGANIDGGTTDPNGDTITLTATPSSFTCSDIGDQLVTLTATDPNGFTNTCTTTVTVSDNVALSAICSSPTISLDTSGNATITTAHIDGGSAVGNCGLDSEYLTIGFEEVSLVSASGVEVGGPGNMFNIKAINPITVNSFDIHANIGSIESHSYEVYYKAGSFEGSQFTIGDWTLVGSTTLMANPIGSLTPLNLSLGIDIAAGETVAFAIFASDGSNIIFENGSALGTLWTSDSNLEFYEGYYSAYPFAGIANPYVFNGNIVYTTASLFDGNFDCTDIGTHTVTLNRRDNTGNVATCDATVTIQDAEDPSVNCLADFAVDSAGDFTLPDYYAGGSVTASDNCSIASVVQTPAPGTSLADGVHAISYLATDSNGRTSTCSFNLTVNDNTLSVDSFELGLNDISLTPNPTADKIVLSNNSQIKLVSAELIDLNGRIITTVNLEHMTTNKEINLSSFANGLYLMRIVSEHGSITKRIVKY
ncbi:HYR domain-containing protein [Lacinutrix iliipiscaria]|uniref:HYR domain-containing protein n=1 Tax=Lacinutrix iliipiscaria TaxID=1230532 RepID=A0ABW5WR81_9FLAO